MKRENQPNSPKVKTDISFSLPKSNENRIDFQINILFSTDGLKSTFIHLNSLNILLYTKSRSSYELFVELPKWSFFSSENTIRTKKRRDRAFYLSIFRDIGIFYIRFSILEERVFIQDSVDNFKVKEIAFWRAVSEEDVICELGSSLLISLLTYNMFPHL